jgi:hypothetical protein
MHRCVLSLLQLLRWPEQQLSDTGHTCFDGMLLMQRLRLQCLHPQVSMRMLVGFIPCCPLAPSSISSPKARRMYSNVH